MPWKNKAKQAAYARGKYKSDPAHRKAHRARVKATKQRWKEESKLLLEEWKQGRGCEIDGCPETETCCFVATISIRVPRASPSLMVSLNAKDRI